MDIEAFREQIDTNLFGVYNVCKAFLPILCKQGSGHIFQILSIGDRTKTPGLSAYQGAKRAVAGFFGVLAAELKPLGVKVTTLEPGSMATDWAGSSMEVPPHSINLGLASERVSSLQRAPYLTLLRLSKSVNERPSVSRQGIEFSPRLHLWGPTLENLDVTTTSNIQIRRRGPKSHSRRSKITRRSPTYMWLFHLLLSS